MHAPHMPVGRHDPGVQTCGKAAVQHVAGEGGRLAQSVHAYVHAALARRIHVHDDDAAPPLAQAVGRLPLHALANPRAHGRPHATLGQIAHAPVQQLHLPVPVAPAHKQARGGHVLRAPLGLGQLRQPCAFICRHSASRSPAAHDVARHERLLACGACLPGAFHRVHHLRFLRHAASRAPSAGNAACP